MENILLTIHLIIAVVLVAVILVQKSEGGALGIGGGNSSQFGIFTARGSANFLTRITAILATCFIATSLLLTIVGKADQSEEDFLIQQLEGEAPSTTPIIENPLDALPAPGAEGDANSNDGTVPNVGVGAGEPAVPLAE